MKNLGKRMTERRRLATTADKKLELEIKASQRFFREIRGNWQG